MPVILQAGTLVINNPLDPKILSSVKGGCCWADPDLSGKSSLALEKCFPNSPSPPLCPSAVQWGICPQDCPQDSHQNPSSLLLLLIVNIGSSISTPDQGQLESTLHWGTTHRTHNWWKMTNSLVRISLAGYNNHLIIPLTWTSPLAPLIPSLTQILRDLQYLS